MEDRQTTTSRKPEPARGESGRPITRALTLLPAYPTAATGSLPAPYEFGGYESPATSQTRSPQPQTEFWPTTDELNAAMELAPHTSPATAERIEFVSAHGIAGGGAERSTSALARSLTTAGYDIGWSFVTESPASHRDRIFMCGSLPSCPAALQAVPYAELLEHFRRRRPAIVIDNGSHSVLTVARDAGVPHRVYCLRNSRQDILDSVHRQALAGDVTHLVVASRWVAQRLCEQHPEVIDALGQEAVSVIENGVTPTQFAPRRVARELLGVSGNQRVGVFVGRLFASKRPVECVRAMQDAGLDRILVLGHGPLRPQVESLANARTTIVGYADPSVYYAAADVCVAGTTFDEGMWRTPFEAAAHGAAVVCNPAGDVREAFADGMTAVVSEAINAAAVERALEADDLGRRGQRVIAARGLVDAITDWRWRQLVSRLLGAGERMPLTSVVIPYVDTPARRRALGHCLRSMDAQTAPVEVILALDCGARGGSARVAEFERWLRSQSPRTRLILQRRRPRCLSASRNDGQRIARGDIIVTADGDMVLPHDFAERVVAVLEHYPRHVVSAGRQRISAPASAVANHLEASLLTRYPEQPAPDDLSAMRKDMLTVTTAFAVWERPWIAACGPLRAVRREIANAYPWDEDYSGWGYEDLDFVYRLHQDGADFHVSSVACHVEHPVTTGKTEDREHNRVLFRRKHGIDL